MSIVAGPPRPDRLPPGGSAWPLVVALAWGMLLWIGTSVAYIDARGIRPAAPTAASQPADPGSQPVPPSPSNPSLATLPPRDVAFLAVVPHVAAFLGVLLLDLRFYHGRLDHLGLAPRQAPPAVAWGLAAGVAVVPLVFGSGLLTEWVYRLAGYEHPQAHELLGVLGSTTDPVVRSAILLGAVVAAPLSEELLFRGHLQTALRHFFGRLGGGRAPDGPPCRRAAWAAVVVASAMFAAVHPAWTWPPIFLLSLCLGWLYERTRVLWAPVALHALFNTTSISFFLIQAGRNWAAD